MGRAPCCDKNGLKKGPWTSEEDEKLIDYIKKHGYGNWRTLPKNAGLQRCGKSCRLRWTNYLRPDIKRGRFSFEEEETVIQLHSILGNKWSAIAARLPGRTDNEIKNYWNTHIRKKLLRMGIDPITHSPRLDLHDLSSILNTACFYNPNMSRLLNVQQPQVMNPELLRLAASFMSSQRESSNNNNNPNFLTHQNSDDQDQTQISYHQIPQLVQSNEPYFQAPSFSDIIHPQELVPDHPNNVKLSNLTSFSSPSSQMSSDQYWQNSSSGMPAHASSSTFTDQDLYVPNLPSTYACFGSDHHQANFADNMANQDFSFNTTSLSTPCSSPKPLNSNSATYFNSCSTNSTTSTEDERESYCSNFFNFKIPTHLLDVNTEFM